MPGWMNEQGETSSQAHLAAYHWLMIETLRGVPVDQLTTALESAGLRCRRASDPTTVVRDVVIHSPGDPDPDPDTLVMCTAPGVALPACVAVVVRDGDLSHVLAEAPDRTAVFSADENVRFSDAYDRVQWVLRESLGQSAVDDAFELADTLATALGGAVAIEDVNRRVVAFSTITGQPIDDVRRQGILDRHVPEHVERNEWYARLWRSKGVCEYPAGEECTARLAIAVRAGAEPVGSIWVVGSRDTLDPEADQILERALGTVIACLAHQDHFASRGREMRTRILRQLLGSGGVAGQALGYVLPGPSVLVAVSGGDELLDVRQADVLSLHAQRFQGFGLSAVLDGRVYALLPSGERERLDVHIKGIMSRVAAPVGPVVVSSVIDQVEDLPSARERVDRLARLHGDSTGIVQADDERINLAFAEIAESLRGSAALQGGTVSVMAQYDRENGTVYVPTLRAWFDACGDVTVAASALHVHQNTFRYRMARAQALFGLDLDDPDERLIAHLKLRLDDFE